MSDYFERQGRSEPPWPRLFKRLQERRKQVADLILPGELSAAEYAHAAGRYAALSQVLDDMENMMRGTDLPVETELPEA